MPTGDFNAGDGNAAMADQRGEAEVEGARTPPPLVDSFRVLYPDATDVGTFCAVDPTKTGGEKIDAVFVEPGASVLGSNIVRDAVPGDETRAQSDHFPVTAQVSWPGA